MDIISKLVASTIVFGLLQGPSAVLPAKTSAEPLVRATAAVMAGNVDAAFAQKSSPDADLIDIFFGPEASKTQSIATVEKKMEYVSTRGAYEASLAVVNKYASTIEVLADKLGVPKDVAIGVAFLENGGSETAVSSAGAAGVFQLMKGTARNLGLTVNSKLDERMEPEKNIQAGITYLRMNYDRFGDWGLATWAYHAGEGNVAKALKIYAMANDGVKLAGVGDSAALKSYVETHGITVHKLLSDPSVRKFTAKLDDDSAGYPYKVIATANLFKQSRS